MLRLSAFADEISPDLTEQLDALNANGVGSIELRGVGATDPVRRVLEARSRRIRRIMRLDPLRLRERLPRGLVEWLFARLAILVRSGAKPPDAADEIRSLPFLIHSQYPKQPNRC